MTPDIKTSSSQPVTRSKQIWIVGSIPVIVCCLLLGLVLYQTLGHKVQSDHGQSQHLQASGRQMKPVNNDEYRALQAVSHKPTKADSQGGLIVSKNGVGKPSDHVPTVDIYMDFLCPPCAELHRALDPSLKKMVEAGQINVGIHTMDFLDRLRSDQYSSRAASAIATIAELDQYHVIDVVASLYAQDFQPSEDDKTPITNEQLAHRIMSVGVSDAVAQQAASGEYIEWAQKLNEYTKTRQELMHTSGSYKGKLTTPTVIINNTYVEAEETSSTSTGYLEYLLKAIGLKSTEVGVAGKIPSIGATGRPL